MNLCVELSKFRERGKISNFFIDALQFNLKLGEGYTIVSTHLAKEHHKRAACEHKNINPCGNVNKIFCSSVFVLLVEMPFREFVNNFAF